MENNNSEKKFKTSYADFSLARVIRQFIHLSQQDHDTNSQLLLKLVHKDEARLAKSLETDKIAGYKILEIGPGQNLQRALFYGLHNEIIGIDLDVLPIGFDIPAYFDMLRRNGLGRFIKTVGRNILVNRKQSRSWARTIGMTKPNPPKMYYGDFCSKSINEIVPGFGTYDAVISWSVFEHLPDPETALQNVIKALKPGGAVLISLHLYTANDGHHDIRGFTGGLDDLPLWGHLRPQHKDDIHPSAYLNEWRLPQWRELYEKLTPGHTLYLDQYEHPERFGGQLTDGLRAELQDYSFEELVTVNVVMTWRKPLT